MEHNSQTPGRRGWLPARAPLRTVRESFPSHSSSLSKAGLVRADPLLDGERSIARTHRNPLGQLGNTGRWPFWLRSIGRQLRDAPSDWRRSSFAIPVLRRFHMLSCHSTPDRRGPIRRATAGFRFFGLLNAASYYPALRLGRPRPAWPSAQLFHVLHSIQDGFRSALLHRQSDEFATGDVRPPGLDCMPFWPEP